MVEYEGTHEIGEMWNLWINGDLREKYVESVVVQQEKWGEDYQVAHLLGDGVHKITVTESDLEEILKPIILRNEVEDSLD